MKAKSVIKVLIAMPVLYGTFWLYRQFYPPQPHDLPAPLPAISVSPKDLVESHGALTATLLRDHFDTSASENFVISPAALFEVGTLLHLATQGESAEAVLSAFPGVDAKSLGGYQARRDELKRRDVLEFASSLWTSTKLNPQFLADVETNLGAQARRTMFPYPAQRSIGEWASRIMRQPHAVAGLERPINALAAFANAGYFKDSWEVKFDKGRTRPRPFTLAGGTDVQVPAMEGDDKSYGYREGKDLFVLTLPFRNGLEFVALVPQKDMAAMLKSSELDEALSKQWYTRPAKGRIQMPRWKVKKFVPLTPILTRLGLGRLFDRTSAPDFAPMGAEMWLGPSQQEVSIELNEDGAEAFTYTSIFFQAKASKPREKNFVIDQPFVFAIRDPEGPIFFAGIIQDPR